MPGKLQTIQELLLDEKLRAAENDENWSAFLRSAANNYKYSFNDQMLIFSQRPDATACAEIEFWNNHLHRWVNKGAKGIALIDTAGTRPRLRYVFDVSDTNSRYGYDIRLWQAEDRYKDEIITALEDSFGELEDKSDLRAALVSTAKNLAEDNKQDYLTALSAVENKGYLDGMQAEGLDVVFTTALQRSAEYMLLSRCGAENNQPIFDDNFHPILFFNTPDTIDILGSAVSDIAEMGLREIETTVRDLQIAEKSQNRTFADKQKNEYDEVTKNHTVERSNDYGTDLQAERRLFDPELDLAGEELSDAGQIRDAAENLPEEPPQDAIHHDAVEGHPVGTPERGGQDSERDDGISDGADGEGTGSDRGTESARSDEVGSDDEQYPERGRGNSPQGTDLQLNFPDVSEQQNTIERAEADEASAFAVSQSDIDAVLTRGSGVSEGKYRIYEQYLKEEGKDKNIAFLRDEYGTGGAYPAVSRLNIDEWHDSKGINVSRGKIGSPDSQVLLSWAKVEKRIGDLIAADRYLNDAEKEHYPVYRAQAELRRQRQAIAKEFRSVVYDYNDYVEQIGEKEKQLHLYYLSSCWSAFGVGDRKMHARTAEGDFILPMMRDAMQTIIADNTHLTERAEKVLADLNGDIARPFEPTYDELNPPPEPEKEYRFSLGDTVYIGSQPFELLSLGDTEVELFDPKFPLFHQTFTRAEFDEKVKENPLNDKYLHVVEVQPEQTRKAESEFSAQEHIYLDNDREMVTWVYYNPDAVSGGQLVESSMSYDTFREFYARYGDDHDTFVNGVNEAADQWLGDINTPYFAEVKADYDSEPQYVDMTPENAAKIVADIDNYRYSQEQAKPRTPFDEYKEVQAENPDSILMFQVGDFFEIMGDKAHTVADTLQIMETMRALPDGSRIPMCGVPAHTLQMYLDMLLDRGYDVTVSALEDGNRINRLVRSMNKDDPEESFHVGAKEYLSTDGSVRERIEYTSEYQFKKDIQEENHYGAPMVVVFYEDRNGETIDRSFISSLDPPPQGVRTEPSPLIVNVYDNGEQQLPDEEFDALPVSVVENGEVKTYPNAKAMYEAQDEQKADEQIVIDALVDFNRNNLAEFEDYQPDLSDKHRIPIAYTTTEDGLAEIQIYVDIIDRKLIYSVDGKDVRTDVFESLDMLAAELGNQTFDSLTGEAERIYQSTLQIEPPKQIHTLKEAPHVLYPEITSDYRTNYRIDNDNIGVGTPLERFHHNIMAIQLLHKLEDEHRLADGNEQRILADYVGWGGLSEFFKEDNYYNNELRAVLNEEEYTAARESTLTAFYTPPVVICAMYQAFENMGFKTGNILEPSCGVGNFMGMLPEGMRQSQIYGVELDSISGRIAQQLYQKNSIAVQGFETTNLPDSFFDAAVGNVPFGQLKINDKRYNKYNFLIHDYFFARSLDKVRPGGIVAFITSSGTLDKENPKVRKYLAQRADLLGAIRLPNNTFKSAAGTEVTADILFLQKRDRLIDIEPDWVHLGQNENGITMNRYFIDNPDMIMGEMKMVSGPYGPTPTCEPYEDQSLSDLLSAAIQNIHGQIADIEFADLDDAGEDRSIPADPNVRNFSYTVVDGEIFYRENSRMNPVDVSDTAKNRIKGLIGIRESVRRLIDLQTEDYSDAEIASEQAKLNELYDDFSKKYGLINSRANNTAFSSDSAYCLLSSLEVLDDDGNFVRKADMFSKRTIKQKVIVQSVDTAAEALALSLAEKAKIDMEYMSELTGKTEADLVSDLQGVIFLNPDSEPKYVPADEYLSGNVREKLKQAQLAAQSDPGYAVNVSALEQVQPKDLTASEISVRLGATWLPPDIVKQFMFELFETPRWMSWNIKVHFSQYTGEWQVEGKSYDKGNVRAANTYGTSRINGYKIIEETLNLRDVRIFDYPEDAEGRKHPVLNKDETAIVQGKQEMIKEAFHDWIWRVPERREQLCRMYNDRFNCIRPRTYDGSHLNFVGMNPEIILRKHQVDAIAHILYGGNTLLAHEVGAGKTFEMVAAAQESKRLGLCQKSLFVVPNHLISQWAAEYLQLYPSANILVATKKDFETKNRKKFCARIATGDYDAVIIGHSQFEKIPMSVERQQYILQQQLEEVMAGIIEMKQNRGDKFSIKQLEGVKKGIAVKLDKLNDQSRKDDLVTFEELGVDRLFIDEAHYYKNLAAFSKMRNVGGISQTEAQKSSDLYMKCRYLDELTGGKGVVFATGTPISNSMVEMYTMQKYLQYGTLERNNLVHFDSWASTFGQTVTAVELSPEGTGYRAKTRFAKFYNLPELMSMFKEVADIQTADMLKLPVPKANFHNVVLKPSETQKQMVASLAERAERVRNKMVSSDKDNMLLITNDGRKLALDQRLMNDMLPANDTGKVTVCANNVFDIWQRTAEQRSAQLVFCDLSTPHGDGKFNVYDDLKKQLVTKGVPESEIAFIHDYATEKQKQELFGKVRNGVVRVLLGSTFKMGAGTNVQKRLVALHHLDTPWRPADLAQRNGRIIRQGNDNPEVDIYTYVTEDTFDSYLYQLVENKQKFIGQIMTSKSPVRSAEDVDEQALSYAEIKMLATGNPHIKEKMDLDIDVSKLKLLKANHLSQKYALEDKIYKEFPAKISALEQRIKGITADIACVNANSQPNADGFCPMMLNGRVFDDKKEAGTEILAVCKAMTTPEPRPLGSYKGFDMELQFDSLSRQYVITLKNECRYNVPLGTDIFGNIQRLDNTLASLSDKLEACKEQLAGTRQQLETAKKDVQVPFPHEDELAAKTKRLAELDAMLNLDKTDNEIVTGDSTDEPDAPERKARTIEAR